MKVERVNLDNALGVVNSARVSFDSESKQLNEKDAKLINYLAKHQHISPFFHPCLYFQIRDKSLIYTLHSLPNEVRNGIEIVDNLHKNKDVFGLKISLYSYLQCAHIFHSGNSNRLLTGFSKSLLSNNINSSKLFSVSFKIECPMFVRNQLDRHRVGIAINELSRRYVRSDTEFYLPTEIRKQSKDNKQGSQGSVLNQDEAKDIFWRVKEYSKMAYETLLQMEVAGEQARMVLPQNAITKFVWTGSLFAFCRVCAERLELDAQQETRELAIDIYNNLCKEYSKEIVDAIIADIKKAKSDVFSGVDIVKLLKELY